MSLEEKQVTRQMIIAWDDKGVMKGGERRVVAEVYKDGTLLATGDEVLIPIAGSVQDGEQVAEALSPVQAEAIAAVNVRTAERDAEKERADKAEKDRDREKKRADDECAKCRELEARIAELELQLGQAAASTQDDKE